MINRPILGGVRSSSGGAPISKELKDHIDGQARQAAKDLAAAQAALNVGGWPWFIEFPDNKDYRAINLPFGFTINSVSTRSTTGTCTITVKINGVALGGTANSVSSTESTQDHTSSNVVAVGDDVTLTVSSNSSAENVAVMLNYTRS